jgi:hypothetical protein
LIQKSVEESVARKAERTHGQLGDDKQHQAHWTRHAIGNVPADQAAATQAGHERGYDQRDGLNIGSRKDREEALPDHLIDERCEARYEKH